MGYKNREIEIKLLVNNERSIASVNKKLESLFKNRAPKIETGVSQDEYWKTLNSQTADFVRLRRYSNGHAQITVKHTDKGDNLDRVEIDLEVTDSKKAELVLKAIQGEPIGTISKKYIVYFLENEDTTVSVYQIKGDTRVFIEVEARTKSRVFRLIEEIEMLFKENQLVRETSSLYQLFLKGNKRK